MDLKRFNFLMAQVPQKTLVELKDRFTKVPSTDRYAWAKAILIAHFSESQQRRMQRVLAEMVLGDQKPSQLYHAMRREAQDSVSEELLLDLWAARLPVGLQHTVVANRGCMTEKLAVADAVFEATRLRPISSVATTPSPPPMSGAFVEASTTEKSTVEMLRQLMEEMRVFKRDLTELKTANNQRGRSRQRNRSLRRSQGRGSQRNGTPVPHNPELCWYHNNFGDNATRCRAPCKKAGCYEQADSGAELSLVPRDRRLKNIKPSEVMLVAANGTQKYVFGEVTLRVSLRLRRAFTWTFIIADVNTAIIGADFLAHYDLLVDLKHKRLLERLTSLETPGDQLRKLSTATYDCSG
ncbi:uncharacterized protein LOC126576572 [Anopheles aquasalis]|uniref:uncharacterized protein LOC126576572 n=1 Tax=Anopheles aquasalis TaxID=42839 RepID=UPI00215A19FE|nr:uncharacterized protein LOC126576572 [Anopheles aquasalis]